MKHRSVNNSSKSVGKLWARPLADLNAKLCRGKVRVHRGRLNYQSSYFPAKRSSDQQGYCNRYDYALRLNADALADKDLYQAILKIVVAIDRDLLQEQWQWPELVKPDLPVSVSDWVKAFELAYWQKKERTPNREHVYQQKYGYYFGKLPSGKLTEQMLIEQVESHPAESRIRQIASQCYGSLADLAGIDSSNIRAAGKGWHLGKVKLRDLPTDQEAWATYESLAQWPEYQSGFLLLLLYGIRPHELIYAQATGLDASAPYIHIAQGKTGPRDAFMLRSKHWPEVQWDGVVPDIERHRRNGQPRSHIELGQTITAQYKRRSESIASLYNYRHLYAVRGFAQGKKIGMMARSMGHSEAVHTRTYQSTVSQIQFQEGW